MMMGSKMGIELDGAGGRTVGSRVRMRGTMLGLDLALEEVVTERERPHHKAWETVDARLFVIGQYRLGFDLEPAAGGTQVTIYIDYALPHRGPGKVLGAMLGRRYARWCIERMAADAQGNFPLRDPK
jgi:hypothetical protein